MNSEIPVWISLTITLTYLMLIVVVTIALQHILHLLQVWQQQSGWVWGISLFLGGWLLLVLALGVQGLLLTTPADPAPRIAYGFIPLAAGIGLVFISPLFNKMIAEIPPQWIIGVQVNRLLGALFLVQYAHGKLPALFAIPAGVGDIFISLSAAIVAYLFVVKHPQARAFGVAWNIAGIIDLLVAVATGVLTSPGQFQFFAFDAPNLLMSTFPFVIISAFGVPVWLLLHFFSLRRLMVR